MSTTDDNELGTYPGLTVVMDAPDRYTLTNAAGMVWYAIYTDDDGWCLCNRPDLNDANAQVIYGGADPGALLRIAAAGSATPAAVAA